MMFTDALYLHCDLLTAGHSRSQQWHWYGPRVVRATALALAGHGQVGRAPALGGSCS
eukprot:COSAG06_NODE_52837_length_303_cov_1.200980_1_plen_56_part_01